MLKEEFMLKRERLAIIEKRRRRRKRRRKDAEDEAV